MAGQVGDNVIEQKLDAVSERLAGMTIPGESNEGLFDDLEDAADVARAFQGELNNWVEILDVRVRNDGKVGIPCRYRWTLSRWAENDMDQWLMDHGWEQVAHLYADSRQHRSNELEARYRKRIEGKMVYTNIFVPVTDKTFRALQDGNPVEKAKNRRERKKQREGILMQKRLR